MTSEDRKMNGEESMDCAEARRGLLDADPEVLQGTGSDPVAIHVRDCPACGARARGILEGHGALTEALAGLGPRMSPAEAEALAVEGAAESRRAGRASKRGRRPYLRRASISLAAAAALAALLLARGTLDTPPPDGTPVPTGEPVALPDEEPAERVHVEVRPDSRTLVLAARDTTITVIWFH